MMLQVILNGLAAGGPIACVALGLSLVFSVRRVFHVAHAGVFTVAAYAAFALHKQLGLSSGMALFVAIVVATGLGLAIEIAIYAPMRRLGASPPAMFVASLGLVVLGQSCVAIVFGSQALSLRSGEYSVGYQIFGARLTSIQIASIALCASTCAGVLALLKWTRAGLLLRAVASDFELARIVGIPRERVILGAFGLASATAALASLAVAYDTDLAPMMGFNILLLGLTAAVIGGLGSVPGAVLGGLLIGLAQHLAGWFLPTQWQDAVVFLMLIAFLLVRPHGLLGRPLREVAV